MSFCNNLDLCEPVGACQNFLRQGMMVRTFLILNSGDIPGIGWYRFPGKLEVGPAPIERWLSSVLYAEHYI